jgi:hypothetical protein
VGAEHLPYLAHLRKRHDSDALPSEVDAIRTLLGSTGWELLMSLLETTHGEAVQRLLFLSAGAEGKVLEQAEYARLLGFLSGLRQSRVAAEAFIEHAERVQRKEN